MHTIVNASDAVDYTIPNPAPAARVVADWWYRDYGVVDLTRGSARNVVATCPGERIARAAERSNGFVIVLTPFGPCLARAHQRPYCGHPQLRGWGEAAIVPFANDTFAQANIRLAQLARSARDAGATHAWVITRAHEGAIVPL
jgi:hypothetical protein